MIPSETPLEALVRVMRDRHVSEAIIERVIRLNPNLTGGEYPRGVYTSQRRAPALWWRGDIMGKRAFIERWGRGAWDRLPASAIYKSGKRAYVTREAILDKLWTGNDVA